MGFDDAPAFRECCPALHEFNAVVHQRLSSDAARARLCEWLTQFVAEKRDAYQKECERQQQRRQYLLVDAFRPGNEHLRDRAASLDGHQLVEYHSQEDPTFGDLYPDGAPDAMRIAANQFWERDPDDWFLWMGIERAGYDPDDGHVHFEVWTPHYLGPAKRDGNLMPQAPLPPKNLGRAYTIPEISWAIAKLHQADGGFEPLVPKINLISSAFDMSLLALKKSYEDGRDIPASSPQDSWLTSLRPLWERLLAELEHVHTNFAVGAIITTPHVKRGAKVKYDATVDEKLAHDWDSAKSCGTSKAEFAKQKGMTETDVVRVLGRVRERKYRAQ